MTCFSRLPALALSASLLCIAGCAPEQVDIDTGGETGDFIDQAPLGKTGFGLQLDLINQFAYALWNSQALDVHGDETLLPKALQADLHFLKGLHLWLDMDGQARLPPVLKMTKAGVTLRVGEFHINLRGGTDVGQLSAEVIVALRADIDVAIKGARLNLKPHFDSKNIHIDLKVSSFAGLQTEAIERIVEGIAPGLVEILIQQLETFIVPSMDLTPSGFKRVLGFNDAVLVLLDDGAVLQGTLDDVDPNSTYDTVIKDRAPISESATGLAACSALGGQQEGDCCSADDGSPGVCTDLDPDGDGSEELFCPSGAPASNRGCTNSHVKCCIYPQD